MKTNEENNNKLINEFIEYKTQTQRIKATLDFIKDHLNDVSHLNKLDALQKYLDNWISVLR